MQASAGGSGKATTFAYDAHELFIAETVNELGHKVTVHRDVANGALVARRGPNAVRRPADRTIREEERFIVATDLDGRWSTSSRSMTRSRRLTGCCRVSRATFFANEERPNRVRVEKRRDVQNDDGLVVTE